MSENHEDPVDERLRSLAHAYNRPPEPPRDAMWARIQAARQEQRQQAHRSRFGRVLPASPAAWAGWAAALAATLVVGIGLGRLTQGRQASKASPAGVAVDTNGGAASRLAAAAGGAVAGDVGQTPQDRASAGGVTPATLAAGRNGAGRPGTGAVGPSTAGSSVGGRLPVDNRVAAVYKLAAAQTFGQADALLTSLRADPPTDTAAMNRLSAWAREVLSSTRLLMDSPAGRDPATTQLLGDLELVLVQIVQLSDENDDPAARKLIEDAVRRHDVLPRIRNVVRSGPAVAGT
jgi:hypothetical protein